jgi:hypothetical protein
MKEIEIRDDIFVTLAEINDGEAICISEENSGEVTDEIILIRPVALAIAKKILEIMGDDEKTEE